MDPLVTIPVHNPAAAAVSGLPLPFDRHADEMAGLAIEVLEAVKHHVIRHMPEQPTQLRIGLHSGNVC